MKTFIFGSLILLAGLISGCGGNDSKTRPPEKIKAADSLQKQRDTLGTDHTRIDTQALKEHRVP
jgi:hypothetical protein